MIGVWRITEQTAKGIRQKEEGQKVERVLGMVYVIWRQRSPGTGTRYIFP